MPSSMIARYRAAGIHNYRRNLGESLAANQTSALNLVDSQIGKRSRPVRILRKNLDTACL